MAFGSEQWMYASGGFYPHEIDQSLRFNDDDSAFLSRTPATTSNQKTWTWSSWVKLTNLDISRNIINVNSGIANVPRSVFAIGSDNLLTVGINPSGTTWYFLDTTQVFRDCSGWYHLVLQVDTTQAVSTNRTKVYVNGQEVSLTGSYVFQNADTAINSTEEHRIGRNKSGANPADYYMAEVNFIDGQALDATDFGEFKSGVWIPKSYSGTYGTNGFRLDFGNSGSLGADVSGNSNNWTPTNLASTDQMLDSPTNNFATWNALESETGLGFSEGNLYWMSDNVTFSKMRANLAYPSSGKWYWEMCPGTKTSTAHSWIIGIANKDASLTEYLGQTANGHGYNANTGKYYTSGNSFPYGDTWTTGDVMGVAWDADTGSLYLYKNNVIQDSGTAMVSGLTGEWFPAVGDATGGDYQQHKANFGQDSSFAGTKTRQGNTDANGIGDFYYAPPAGYLALCTANLPDPVIDPAQDDVPEDYFNTVLYTGNGSTQSITGVGFQPDFVWLKSRSFAANHGLHDVLRVINGNEEILYSNLTNAGNTGGAYLSSFNSDGFTVNANTSGNGSGSTFTAWNWKADGTGVTNTDGSITSTVSANQKAGFSIVSYTGNGAVTDQTVGHGLSGSEMVIVKNRSSATDGNWRVAHSALSPNYNLALNLTVAEFDVTASTHGGIGTLNATSNTFTLKKGGAGTNNTNQSGVDYIAYCFTSVDGYSKFGSYTGNGSTDGPFVYTGFRPAFVLIKKATGTTADWFIADSDRNTYNPVNLRLMPNLADADTTTSIMPDFLSNGFKLRSGAYHVNSDTVTYIYMAFAEMPAKYSLGA